MHCNSLVSAVCKRSFNTQEERAATLRSLEEDMQVRLFGFWSMKWR